MLRVIITENKLFIKLLSMTSGRWQGHRNFYSIAMYIK